MSDLGIPRIGIIGTGDFGVRHAAIAAALPEVHLVAVADADVERAGSVAVRYGVRQHPDAETLLAQERLDGVVIATPGPTHLPLLEAALLAQVDVLVEKPIVGRADDITAFRDVVSRSSNIVMPGHVSRFLPAFAALRERVLGHRVLAIRALRRVPTARLDLHGGEHPALVAMVHDLDLVQAIVPGRLEHVSAVQTWTDPSRPHPQIVMAHLRFDNGTLVSIENHWTLPHERQYIEARLEVTTDHGIFDLQTPATSLRIVNGDGDFLPDVELDATVDGMPVGALATQMRHFADCVRHRRPSRVVSVEDALWSVEVASRIAAQSG